jgi:hypothetical protein
MTSTSLRNSSCVAFLAALALHGCGRSHQPEPEGGTATVIEETVFACVPPTAVPEVAIWFETSEGGMFVKFYARSRSFDSESPPDHALLVPVSFAEVHNFEQADRIAFGTEGRLEATAATGRFSLPDERTITLRGRFTFRRGDGSEVVVDVDLPRVQPAPGC